MVEEFPKHLRYYTYSVSYYAIIMLMKMVTSNSCNIGMSSLPDMYIRSPRADSVHIRQAMSAHVTSVT